MTFNAGPTGYNQTPYNTAGYGQLPKFKGYSSGQFPNLTPEMFQVLQQLASGFSAGAPGATDWLSRLASGDQGIFEEIEAPSYASFDKLLGNIANRFSQFGARDSSAFQGATAGAAQELAQNLGAQRAGYRNQAVQSLLQNSQNLLQQRPFENILAEKPQKSHWYDSLLGGAGTALGLLPLLAMGPAGIAPAIAATAATAGAGAIPGSRSSIRPGATGYR